MHCLRHNRGFILLLAKACLIVSTLGSHAPGAQVPNDIDYNQWKQALGTNAATSAEHLQPRPGFKVELVRSAGPAEGSWVAMTFDPRGRVVIAREDRGLLRLTLPSPSFPGVLETINTNLLECRGLLFAHGALYANANNSKGLYRLRDTDNDEQFDEVKLLRATPGGVGHGRNQLALGPDGMIYSVHGDDVGLPADGVSPDSPMRHMGDDQLVPCAWDKHLFNAGARMPFGHVIRTDPDGKRWELVAGGLRNAFGLAFNESGELFVYDADMEWDVGLPWYHPTRVLHIVPGGDYGWRRGTGVLPVWSPDTLPSAVDIGLGSPTAIQFGTRSRFPEPWRSALFILDWAYGKIYAVHLARAGATYRGRTEVFLQGRPLNVTGLDFGPDGALYFVTGGRRTQSGLYRVTSTAPRPPASETTPPKGSEPSTPSSLSRLQGGELDHTWSKLGSADPWVRHSARIALEQRSVVEWQARALEEADPTVALTALLALARAGKTNVSASLFNRLHYFSTQELTAEQELLALRALAVASIRKGRPESKFIAASRTVWEARYGKTDPRVNQAICEWLVYLESPKVVATTLDLMDRAASQEEKLEYLYLLRTTRAGWTVSGRQRFVAWLGRARTEFRASSALPMALNYIRSDFDATLTEAERQALTPDLQALDRSAAPVVPVAPPNPKPFVKSWAMNDFTTALAPSSRPETLRGRKLFEETGCAQCHRFGNSGGLVGPDLTSVGARMDRRALLESILEPSRVIAEIYRNVTIALKSGDIVEGRIVKEEPNVLVLAINPVEPEARRRVNKSDIISQRTSETSPMPAGLVNTLQRDEIMELVDWLAH